MRYVLIIMISIAAAIAQAEHAPNIAFRVRYGSLLVITRPGEEGQDDVELTIPLHNNDFPRPVGPGHHDVVTQHIVLDGPKDFCVLNNLGLLTEEMGDCYWLFHDFPGSHGGVVNSSSWQHDEVSLAWRLGTSTIEFNVGAPQQEGVILFDLFAFEGASLIETSRVVSNFYGHPVRLDFHQDAYSLTWHEGEPPEHIEFYTIPLPVIVPGDMNFNREVDFDDIGLFVLALSSPAEYLETIGRGIIAGAAAGDHDQDGDLDFGDIRLFISALNGDFTGAIPEPSTLVLAITILFFAAASRVVHKPLAIGRWWFK
jgi:hypothetical protein